MMWLFFVSLMWAFSFGLIKGRLAGLDPFAVTVIRLALSSLVFLPLWRPRALRWKLCVSLMAIGAVQYGLMYVTYIAAFKHLAAHQVAVFTIFTPLYMAILLELTRKTFSLRLLVAALLAVAGSWIITGRAVAWSELRLGFLLIQVSNICFGAGQLAYRYVMARGPKDVPESRIFFWLFLGGALLALLPACWTGGLLHLDMDAGQMWTLLYLGLLPSGLGFFLWNYGARRVGAGFLAVMNNLKIPLAVACSLLFFGEQAGLVALATGGALLAFSLYLVRPVRATSQQPDQEQA